MCQHTTLFIFYVRRLRSQAQTKPAMPRDPQHTLIIESAISTCNSFILNSMIIIKIRPCLSVELQFWCWFIIFKQWGETYLILYIHTWMNSSSVATHKPSPNQSCWTRSQMLKFLRSDTSSAMQIQIFTAAQYLDDTRVIPV